MLELTWKKGKEKDKDDLVLRRDEDEAFGFGGGPERVVVVEETIVEAEEVGAVEVAGGGPEREVVKGAFWYPARGAEGVGGCR